MRRALVPLTAAALGLAGTLAATQLLYLAGSEALDRVLHERLLGAGETAARLLADAAPDADRLRGLMAANALDGAYVVDGAMTVLADANGPAGRRVDLLRADPDRIQDALNGQASAAFGYAIGQASVTAGYFPVRGIRGNVTSVLALEAGPAFAGAARAQLARARWLGLVLALVAAAALAAVAAGWSRAERLHRESAERAARADMLQRMAAAAAHDIRNPLGVIRGTVELTRQRAKATLSARDLSALDDILGEVERLRQLTDDFLDLAADRPMARAPVDLAAVLDEAARATEAAHPQIRVERDVPSLPTVEGDAGRLGQVFRNLLANAAEAQKTGAVRLEARRDGAEVIARVVDTGPGVPSEIRPRLFEPFATAGKSGGTGLGLAICRRLVERHGGRLSLLPEGPPGAVFEVRLPVREA